MAEAAGWFHVSVQQHKAAFPPLIHCNFLFILGTGTFLSHC